MKNRNAFLFIILLIFSGLMLSCSEESMQGPEGVKGPLGDTGAKGDKGDPGDGVPVVLKYSFTINKGTTAWTTGDWVGGVTGASNGGLVYAITVNDLGGLSLDSPEHLVVAYARPEGVVNYGQKKMLPYVFGVNNSYGIKIELLNNRGTYGNIFMSRSNADGWDNVSMTFPLAPQKVHLDIFFIEIRNVQTATKVDLANYEKLNSYSLNQKNDSK